MHHNAILVLTCLACLTAMTALSAVARTPGAIIFSNRSIDPASPAGLTDQFKAGDRIYAVAFLDKSLLGVGGKETAKKVNVEIFLYELKPPLYDYQQPSEEQLETSSLNVSGASLQNDYLTVDIVPDPASMTAYGNADFEYKKFGPAFDGPVKFAARLSQMEPGDHTIVVKVQCNYNFVAEGTFTLSGENFGAYQSISEGVNAAATGLKTQDTVMPKAAMTDKKLADEMTAAFLASQTYKDRIKGAVQRIVIIDPDWMIRRHELTGVILHRYIRAAIAVKNADGTCTLWNLVTFQQDYVGSAFQKTKFDGVGDPVPIPCGSINK